MSFFHNWLFDFIIVATCFTGNVQQGGRERDKKERETEREREEKEIQVKGSTICNAQMGERG